MLKRGSKVVITGGAGFIGSHLASALAAMGATVRILDDLSSGKPERLAGLGSSVEILRADVRNPATVRSAMKGANAVVHLAGTSPALDPARAQEVKVGGALHILSAARQQTPSERPRIVLCSSGSVYGKQAAFVLHEELAPQPCSVDGVLHYASEQLGRVHRALYNVPVVSLRIFRTFGPGEDGDRPDAGIVTRFLRAAIEGRSPVIFGDGQQTRDLVYVANVTSAVVRVLELAELPEHDTLNIGSGEAVALNFLWSLVLEVCGKKRVAIEPTYLPAPPSEPRHSRAQVARACKDLDWAPSVRLRQGLQRTFEEWQRKQDADPNSWFAPMVPVSARVAPPLPNEALLTLEESDLIEDAPEPQNGKLHDLDIEWAQVATPLAFDES